MAIAAGGAVGSAGDGSAQAAVASTASASAAILLMDERMGCIIAANGGCRLANAPRDSPRALRMAREIRARKSPNAKFRGFRAG